MKKIRARRKFLRINNPMSFGILCAVLLLVLAGGGYALASEVIIPAADRIVAANTTPTPSPTVTPEVVTPIPQTPTPTPEPTPEVLTTVHPFTGELMTMTPTPEPTATPEAGTLEGRTIVIDAGKSKGGKHRGVSSRTYEYKINFAFAEALREELTAQGAEVIMTRASESKVVGAETRIRTINNSKADIVISLFCNDHSDSRISGAEAFVPKKSSHTDADAKLARAVLNGYTTATGMPIRSVEGEGNIRYVTNKDVLNGSKKPVMGLVLGQLSNRSDDKNLNDKEFIAKAARGIAAGILSYFAN